MKTKILMSAVLVLTLMLAACAPKAAAATKKSALSTAIPPTAKPLATPTKITKTSPTANPTKSPAQGSASTPATPLDNDILVNDQTLKSNEVLVSLVDAMKPGWVAIFTDENGHPGNLLGYTAVPAGTSNDIKVNVDSNKATNKMIAMLLLDAGKLGTFEYPGPDIPVQNAYVNNDVMAIFNKIS